MMAAGGLRQLSERERLLINEFSARHGQVRSFAQPIADDAGNVSSPLIRLPLLARLEARGTITAGEAAAGSQFHALFRIAALDNLRAADVSRTPGGMGAGDIPAAAERCRRRVSAAIVALGGGASAAAGVIWHVIGLEQSVRAWCISTGRPHQLGSGILVAALGLLAVHFAIRR